MSSQQEEQIFDLQMRVAFQEEALNCVSEQMAALTMDLQLARKQIQLLSNKIKNGSENDTQSSMADNERPPHY